MTERSTRTLRHAVAMQLRGRMLAGLPILLATPVVLAQEAPAPATSQTAGGLEEIVVTAQKRVENLQAVPLSIQALGTERLEELQINGFDDYVKYLPSVSFTTLGPGFGLAYFRGVASGENNNHSGPSPSVGMYLDEQPITTIQGALDVHLYDVARVEALAGPQGTLYGASSQAGTIRIITNKPDPSAFDAGYGLEVNSVSHGGMGYLAEGFVNLPLSERAAIRLVGWARHDAGFIDNVKATRTYPTSGGCITNSKEPTAGCATTPAHAKDDYNDVDTYGARMALRVDLNDNWTITPQIMGQTQEAHGNFAYDPAVGDLQIAHFYPEKSQDDWVQAALTVEGKIGNFDLVYAGSYLKRDDVVDQDYADYTFFYDQCCGYAAYWGDDTGVPLLDPSQYIHGTDGYTRQSHELRLASPQDKRLRFVGGLFYQQQEHEIFQRYKIDGLGGFLSEGAYLPIEVTGWEDTIWLTNQLREDKEEALFGELSFDLTDNLTATAGLRWFKTENSLKGFFGYNANYSSNYGEALCFSDKQYKGSPCTNLDDKVDEDGTVPKFNLTYRFNDDALVYATYSEGFRPGGINRNATVPPYKSDYLTNYELGWKTMWGGNRLRLNGAVFHEEWDDIQYSFLPPSGAGLTVIKNAGSAEIDGIEMDLTWAATDALLLSGGLTWLDSQLTKDYVPDPEEPPAAFKGDSLPITPDFKANLTARYNFQVGGNFDAYVQGAAVYNGSSYSDLPRAEREAFGEQDGYTIVDLSAGVTRGDYTLTLFINNVFDELARTYTYAQCTVSVCGGNPYYAPTQPLTIGLKFSQEF
jgi:outer membrane receptor protein involved in Fe transport